MAFRPSHFVYYSQADSEAAFSAHAWRRPHRLSGQGVTYTPGIAVDSQGVIHVVWSEQIPVEMSEEEIFRDNRSPYLSDIFYRWSADGGTTWSAPVNLSHTPNVGSGRVQIRIDTQDIIHVSWDEGWDRNAQGDPAGGQPVYGMHVHSLDGGHTWSAPQVFNAPQTDNAQMALGLDNKGGVLLIWRSRELQEIYYTWSEDGGNTWSAVEQVPGIHARPWGSPYDAYDTATDSLGRIHLLAVATTAPPEQNRPPLGVYHLTWDGKAWLEPLLVAHYPGPSNPEYPKIAVGQGNHLYAVWFVRPEGLSTRNMRIWYSELKIDAPLEESVPVPTATATPTTAPTSTPKPTATPTPALGFEDSGMPEGLYTESDELVMLAVALSPVLLLVMILAMIRLAK